MLEDVQGQSISIISFEALSGKLRECVEKRIVERGGYACGSYDQDCPYLCRKLWKRIKLQVVGNTAVSVEALERWRVK